MKKDNSKLQFMAYRSFYTPINTINKFSDAGYDTICVFPAHTLNSRGTPYSQYDPTWLWYDKFDFSPFDKMIQDMSTAMPDARFLCMIDLNTPCWLEHMYCFSCTDSFNNLGKAVHTPAWVQATQDYLKAFVEYANRNYGDRILAYILACGNTDEWYDFSNGTDCPERCEAWRKWQLANKRPNPIDIPPQSVRNNATHEDFLRNPEKDGLAIEYWQFCNHSIADTILKFAALTRSIVKDKAQIGCFYGYILEVHAYKLVSCGHLCYEKVLDSPDIDFLITPGTYNDRKIGGGSGFLTPNGTAAVRNKRLFHECDQRTSTSNNYLKPYIYLKTSQSWPDEKSTIAGLKREAALGMLNNTHLWWFDMWGDFYQGEAVMNTMAQIKTIWDNVNVGFQSDMCEVAMIVDAESTYMVNQNHERTSQMNLGIRNKLNRLGAAYDVYSFNDIPKIKDFKRYKFVIFTSLFMVSDEKKKILNEYVLCNNRYVLWMYAPGIYSNNRFDIDNCQKLTGIPYAADGLKVKSMGGWTSCYMYEYADLTTGMLKELAKTSGVIMTTEKELPVYARGDMIAVHTAEGGNLVLNTDKKYSYAHELFTDKRLKIEDGQFVYLFASPDTALFRLI